MGSLVPVVRRIAPLRRGPIPGAAAVPVEVVRADCGVEMQRGALRLVPCTVQSSTALSSPLLSRDLSVDC